MNVFEAAAFAAKLGPIAVQLILAEETSEKTLKPSLSPDGTPLTPGAQRLERVLDELKVAAVVLLPGTPWEAVVADVTLAVNALVKTMNDWGKLNPHTPPAVAPAPVFAQAA